MKSREFPCLVVGLACLVSCSDRRNSSDTGGKGTASAPPVLGMYVHEGWPYNHPYAARTWTIDDWRGYADGLKRLGYNTMAIWPALEITTQPLSPSDRANIEKTAEVIDVLHHEFGMRVFIIRGW